MKRARRLLILTAAVFLTAFTPGDQVVIQGTGGSYDGKSAEVTYRFTDGRYLVVVVESATDTTPVLRRYADANLKPKPTPTPSPSPAPTATPTATATPTPTPTPSPTPTATATPTATPEPTPDPDADLLFADDFDGPAGPPDAASWSQYPWAPTGTTQVPGAARLDGNGNLEIVVRDSTEAGAVWTKDKRIFAPPFTATAWIEFPASHEIWHSWWWENGDWLLDAEIDFYESEGSTDQGAIHEWHSGVDTGGRIVNCPAPGDGLHRYGAHVELGQVTFLRDGEPCASLPLSAAFGSPGYLILNLWPSNAWGPSGFPATLRVARVEVRRG